LHSILLSSYFSLSFRNLSIVGCSSKMEKEDTLLRRILDGSREVLLEGDVHLKAKKAISLFEEIETEIENAKGLDLNTQILPLGCSSLSLETSARPHLNVVAPGKVMKRVGDGVNSEKIINTLHALAHMESWAIDLSFDIVSRYVHENMPLQFFLDWLRVGWDEARHFVLLSDRLEALGAFYGSKPVHDGLWESAMETKDSLLCRLAIMHIVHEGRGLDTTPKNIDRLRSCGDKKSADALAIILNEEASQKAALCPF